MGHESGQVKDNQSIRENESADGKDYQTLIRGWKG
jgi:hypothetical protein